MHLRPLKRALVQLATTLAVLVGAFFVYGSFATHQGKKKAEALCETMPVGTDERTARAAIAAADTGSGRRFFEVDRASVAFQGAFLDRWLCTVAISNAKVVSNEVRLID